MTLLQRKQELIQQINNVKDEDVLIMLEEELSYRLQNKTDITDELTPFEQKELEALANDESDKDTISLTEFRKATEKWRTK